MKKKIFNPYLPSWEYVPDGEPHVFEGRLYVYGSHDKAHGIMYCEEDYVGWSAPLDDLSDWRFEGVIYRKDQDQGNENGEKKMFAPDAAKGPDGRYYLYYGLSDVKYIAVAVSNSPAGPFEYYGTVRNMDGSFLDGWAFDPAILVEEEKIYLYYGFSPKVDKLLDNKFSKYKEIMPGAYVVQLDVDMKTAISAPILVANGYVSAEDTDFSEHPFFEASSIRKINNQYYFVYSSLQGHELCYATSDSPLGPFMYRGVIISNGDIGITKDPVAYFANNHGGIVEISGQYYIFYHRHTHGIHYSRQGCAEKITILDNGDIPQVEITSSGLNDGPLCAAQSFPAYIICNLHGPKKAELLPSKPPYDKTVPFLTETIESKKEDRVLYLSNLQNGAVCGVKYLEFSEEKIVSIIMRGTKGTVEILLDSENGEKIAQIDVNSTQEWNKYQTNITDVRGKHAVYFKFKPVSESMDFLEFKFA